MCISPSEEGHHVFWCPKDFPSSFVTERDAQNIETDAGLTIIFFATKKINGEDIFDAALPDREGTFRQYNKEQLRSNHISYYAYARQPPEWKVSHLRKNKIFALVRTGKRASQRDQNPFTI